MSLPSSASGAPTNYRALYPADPAAFVLDEDAVASGDEQCFIVHFHIKEDCIPSFKTLLLHECMSVLLCEPGMLRYDMYESTDEPGRFMVLEVLADRTARAAHEARRRDGTLRTHSC